MAADYSKHQLFFLSLAYLMNHYSTEALTNPRLRIASYGTLEKSYVYYDGPEVVLGLGALTEIIRQDVRVDQKLFVFNVCPVLYILSDRLPASPYLWVLPGYLSDSQRHEIKQSLMDFKPPVIVYDNLEQAMLQTDARYREIGKNKESLTEIYDFLNQYYFAVPLNEKFTIYRLKSSLKQPLASRKLNGESLSERKHMGMP